MNERNVNALAAIIMRIGLPTPRGAPDTGWYDEKDYAEMAKQLASRGVLVPSALTDEECERVAEDSQAAEAFDRSTANSPEVVRDVLERIAKGETD